MEIKSAEEIIAEVKAIYENDPDGWKILRSRDDFGHLDTFIKHKKNLWQTKTEFKNPIQPVGVGSEISINTNELDEFDLIVDVLEPENSCPFAEIYPQEGRNPIFAGGTGMYSKAASKETLSIISSKHTELQYKLRQQLDKFLHREGLLKEYL